MVTDRGAMARYVGLSYLLFWILLGATGGVMALGAPEAAVTAMKNVCAWAPTFVVLLMFRRLYPGTPFREYLREHFAAKVNPWVFPVILLVQVAILLLAVLVYAGMNGLSLESLPLVVPASLPAVFLINLTSGATGEELGWRGYLQNAFQTKVSPAGASLRVGLIWAFWHVPLWFLSGYTGAQLIQYSLSFLVGNVAVSFFISFFYNRHKNILVVMWIHFLFNFLTRFAGIEGVALLTYLSAVYAVSAAVLVLVDRERFFLRPEPASTTT